ncbi:MAG: sodium-dependent transporter [Prevotellaceae bacterium]|jgi:NSS family neurotransmitter:Na+ symporter|nr:sodium-dependent transporter [Prevotellaceae bacterium]
MKQQRATFNSKLGLVMASVGSAIGLGNIWRFPCEAGEHGGGAFLIVYIFCVMILGLSVMLAEFFLGRASQKDAVGAFKVLAPCSMWKIAGYNGVVAAFCIVGFYSVVSGWTLEYIYQSATGNLNAGSVEEFTENFKNFTSDAFRPVLWVFIFMLITHFIVLLGVKKGIEQTSKLMMPLLFVILIILCVRSLMLPNSIEGLKFFFKPDFSKITSGVILSALGQAFFSVSVGMGCMITYASYFNKSINMPTTAVSVVALDTLVAILAGIVIFPAVTSFNISPSQGPTLVFVTLPNIFQQMPFGNLWSLIFFVLLAIAALTSIISLHEVVTAYLHEQYKMSRNKAATIVSLSGFAIGIICSLSFGVLSHIKIFGVIIFDLLDFITANLMLPLGGMFICIFVGWFINKKFLKDELTNNGTIKFRLFYVFFILIKYIAPIIIALVCINQLGLF